MHTSEEMKGLFLRQSLCDLLMDVEESEERGRFKDDVKCTVPSDSCCDGYFLI